MIYYKPIHFEIEELVDPITLKQYGKEFILKHFFDSRILYQIDLIRDWFDKPMIINNWCFNGKFKYRGFRPFNCKVGSKNSAHKFGRAIDFDIVGLTAEFVRKEIMRNQKQFPYITRMEDKVNWVHFDCVNENNKNGIILFKP